MALSLQMVVYSANDPSLLIGVLPNTITPQALEQIKDFGVGSFNVPMNDAKLRSKPELLDYRNIVRVKDGDQFIHAFRIETVKSDFISSAEFSGQVYNVTGKSLKNTFDDAVVFPYRQLQALSRDKRYFSWASEEGAWYNPNDWKKAFRYGTAQKPSPAGDWIDSPKDWPEAAMGATWLGGEPFKTPMAMGDQYFRRVINPGAGTYRFYASADDWFELYIDGELLLSTDIRIPSLTTTSKVDVVLTEGEHILAFHIRNTFLGPTALIHATFRIKDDGSEEFVSDSRYGDWLVLSYPERTPGWSTGEVLLKLMEEARDRGVIFPRWLYPTFSKTHDSYGNPWTNQFDWSFEVGESMSSVIKKMEEIACDIWIDYNSITLNMAPSRGVDKTISRGGESRVVFRMGENIRKASSVGISRVKNSLVAKSNEQWFTDRNVINYQSSIDQHGRLEASIKTPASNEIAKALIRQVFLNQGDPEESAAYEVLATKGKPFVDFNVGDWVLAPDKSGQLVTRRIVSISAESPEGNTLHTIEFDTLPQIRQERLNRAIESGTPLTAQYSNAGNSPSSGTTGGGSGGSSGGGGGGSASNTALVALGEKDVQLQQEIDDLEQDVIAVEDTAEVAYILASTAAQPMSSTLQTFTGDITFVKIPTVSGFPAVNTGTAQALSSKTLNTPILNGLRRSVQTVSTSVTLGYLSSLILVSTTSAITITLPAVLTGFSVIIKLAVGSTGDVTIQRAGTTATIDGATSIKLTNPYSWVEVEANTANWFIVNEGRRT